MGNACFPIIQPAWPKSSSSCISFCFFVTSCAPPFLSSAFSATAQLHSDLLPTHDDAQGVMGCTRSSDPSLPGSSLPSVAAKLVVFLAILAPLTSSPLTSPNFSSHLSLHHPLQLVARPITIANCFPILTSHILPFARILSS